MIHGGAICNAEVGRPGALHGCRRYATVRVQGRWVPLYYCNQHKNRTIPGNKFNSVADRAEVVSIR
jgi:hypothetical protein